MDWSKAEIAAWTIAVAVVIGMGVLVWKGPFHNINKTAAKSAYPPVAVRIVTATGSHANEIGMYQPKTVTVHVGQQVIFTNVGSAPHTVTEDSNLFDSKNLDKGGASWVYTATKPGRFPYYCNYHPLMHGTIVVK